MKNKLIVLLFFFVLPLPIFAQGRDTVGVLIENVLELDHKVQLAAM